MTQEEKIRAHVDKSIDLYKDQCGIAFGMHAAVQSSREHIVNIGTSVLCTKWEVGFPGGSFVQAVVNNDLHGALGRADNINQDCIKFYSMLLYNTGYIE
jgi:hypothetical protein